MRSILRAPATTRGSVVNTPGTSVQISHTAAPSAAAIATAVVSEPPRPSVVISSDEVESPWNPAMITTLPPPSASMMRLGLISTILAAPCCVSVMMPACEPV